MSSSTSARRRLHRPARKRILSGVAAGLADFFNFNSTLLRLIFVILTLIGGLGLLLYLLLWLLTPEN